MVVIFTILLRLVFGGKKQQPVSIKYTIFITFQPRWSLAYGVLRDLRCFSWLLQAKREEKSTVAAESSSDQSSSGEKEGEEKEDGGAAAPPRRRSGPRRDN